MKTTYDDVRRLVREAVFAAPGAAAAVFLSGGLDSTIVLHELSRAADPPRAYTLDFGLGPSYLEPARRVADHYGVEHTLVLLTDFVERLPEIMAHFHQPRYNVWPWWLAEVAAQDGCKTVFLGEGADEHFGGYMSKDYLHGWAGHLEYIVKTYEPICAAHGLRLQMPFAQIPWETTRPHYCPPEKWALRQAYRDILPDFVIEARKAPPGMTLYEQIWAAHMNGVLPDYHPRDNAEVKAGLQYLATRAWLQAHEGEFVA